MRHNKTIHVHLFFFFQPKQKRQKQNNDLATQINNPDNPANPVNQGNHWQTKLTGKPNDTKSLGQKI